MADRYWVGGTGSKSWADTANWSASLGGAGGATVPATGDSAYILQGTSNIDQGLNQSAVDLARLHIGFDGTVGTSSTALQIGLQASGMALYEVLRIWGTNVSVNIAPTMTGTIPLAQVFGNSGSVTFSGGTLKGFIWSGTSGLVTIGGNCASSGFSVSTMGAAVVIEDMGVSDLNSVSIFGGLVKCANATASSVNVYDGTFVAAGDSTHASIAVYGNGVVDYASTGTITGAYAYGGTFTAANASAPFTVTNSVLLANGTLFESPPVTITYSNATVKYGFA